MKNGIKVTAAAALAVSAFTPVAAFAAETNLAPGYYSDSFTSVSEFSAKVPSEKKAFFLENSKKANFVFVDNAGNVYDFLGSNGDKILNAVTDKEIQKYAITLDSYEKAKDVKVTESGIVKDSVAGELKVESVSAINSTKLAVTFNQKVDKNSAEKLENYYIGLTEANVADSSVEALNTGNYTADLQADGKTVIISGATEDDVIWADKYAASGTTPSALKVDAATPTPNEVVKGKTVYVQVRNIKDAVSGKLMDTQEESFKAVDAVAPKLYGSKVAASGAVTATTNNVTETLVTTGNDVFFIFDEPINDVANVKFYLNSRNISNHVTIDTVTDPTGKTIKIDGTAASLEDYVVGEYTFEAVGVEDLAGNKAVNDTHTAVLKVVEPAEGAVEAPTVQNITQTEEGKFVVTFAAAPENGTLIVVKDSEGNTVKSQATTGADATVEVEFATDITDYNTSTELLYTVEVTGADGGKIVADGSNKTADKYKKVHKFQLDLTAPTVVYSTIGLDGKEIPTVFANTTKINVPFADAIFGGKMALAAGAPAKNIVLKLHSNGETYTLVIPFADLTGSGASEFDDATGMLTLDIADLVTNGSTPAVKEGATALLNDAKTALLAGDYELTLPRGLITDTDEKKLVKGSGANLVPFAGDVINFKVTSGPGATPSVPQTAQDLVSYDDSQDAIIVEFVGRDIKAETAKNPANYTLAGNVLESNTKIEYQTLKDAAGNVTGGVARIFLNNDTIARDGNYTLTVKNVATTAGAKMLPTSVTVNDMLDNTLPVLQTAVITGNAKLELTFSESIDIAAGNEALAAANFLVEVNGAAYNVATATPHATNDKVVVIELNDTIQYAGKTVTVTTKKNQNNDVFVTDIGNNLLKVGTKVIATVKQ